jgi:hypothetical protein
MISLSKFLGAVADVLDTTEVVVLLLPLVCNKIASLRKEIPRTKIIVMAD